MSTNSDGSQSTTSTVEIDNIDDFLPMPGAESIVTNTDNAKPTLFSKAAPVDMDFLDKKDEETTPAATDDVSEAISALDADLTDEEDADTKKPGRRKTDKSGLVEFLKKRIDANEMFAFDDFDETKQTLDEYLGGLSEKDVEELWKENIDAIKNDVAAKTPQEFYDSLPQELQAAAEYVAKGGTDIKGMFRALAETEELRSLNPEEPDHQEMIVRQYLQASGFGGGDQELIEDQLQEWVESGVMQKKATQFKPKLDAMSEEVVQSKIVQQEAFRAEQVKKKEAYMENIYNTLKPAELNGVKLDNKRQKFLWDELTTVKYESMTGRPTNLLGKLLEDHQFSKTPRYDLIAETLWLLSDPEDYKENIRRQVKNEATQETVRKLKTEESRKISSSNAEEVEDKAPVRKLTKARNIFSNR